MNQDAPAEKGAVEGSAAVAAEDETILQANVAAVVPVGQVG